MLTSQYVKVTPMDCIQLQFSDAEALIDLIEGMQKDMEIEHLQLFSDSTQNQFIVTFPKGINNEKFVFFYSALVGLYPFEMANIPAFGWFYANDDMTLHKVRGAFDCFESDQFALRIMMLPDGDGEGPSHQYGITENGKEIHFGMDGSFRVLPNTKHVFKAPDLALENYEILLEHEMEFDAPKLKKSTNPFSLWAWLKATIKRIFAKKENWDYNKG